MVHGCMVYTELAREASVSCGTSHASAVSTPLRWIFKNTLQKASHSCRIKCKQNESAREWRIALYKQPSINQFIHKKSLTDRLSPPETFILYNLPLLSSRDPCGMYRELEQDVLWCISVRWAALRHEHHKGKERAALRHEHKGKERATLHHEHHKGKERATLHHEHHKGKERATLHHEHRKGKERSALCHEYHKGKERATLCHEHKGQ